MNKTQNSNEWETLQLIQQNIFDLTEENISVAMGTINNKFDINYSYSFNLIVSQMIYFSFAVRRVDVEVYIDFIKEIKKFEENNNIKSDILNVFTDFLLRRRTQESYYIIENLIQNNLVGIEVLKNIQHPYFLHYESVRKRVTYFPKQTYSLSDLSNNNWELHKKLIKEGVNPLEIAKIIRNDEVKKLQEISSQNDFDYNQKIKSSLYERCSFINQNNVTLIDYAAFFSAVKCFKYLLMNNAKVENTGKYAIAGGNLEIIHLCKQNHSSFKNSYQITIEYHRNEIFKYIYENKLEKINDLEEFGMLCILYHNYKIFSFLQKEGMKINDDIINESAKNGNIFLVKHFLKENQLPKYVLLFSSESGNWELLKYILEQKGADVNVKDKWRNTALIYASQSGYTEMVKFLLEQKGINFNAQNNDGQTALISASIKGYVDIVKLLLKQKEIDVNKKDYAGQTALTNATQNGHKEVVILLLEHNRIDVNSIDIEGRTALILASQSGYTEIVKLLLNKKGIDINIKDNLGGKTAIEYACANGHKEIMLLLLDQE